MRPFIQLWAAVGIVAILLAPPVLHAQSSDAFRTSFSSAFFVTPVNAAINVLPESEIDIPFSLSGEYSFRKAENFAFVFSAGYYPYIDRQESQFGFGFRHFSKSSSAPVGVFTEFSVLAGSSRVIDPPGIAEPFFGIGAKIGNVRTTRFVDFGFEYGVNTSALVLAGKIELRVGAFFGIGYLFGKEILVR
jgi:hypothetical protein